MKSRAPKPRTRQALWSVKQEKPELFEQHEKKLKELEAAEKSKSSDVPPGFEPCAYGGWLHHSGQNSYYEKKTRRLCWLDPETQEFRDLHEGADLALAFVGGAASCCGKAAASAAPDAEAAGKVLSVVIPDMHRAAQALKVDLGHLDRPAAMVALFGTCPKPIVGVPADVVARAFHERLMKRLGRFRGVWGDELLGAAIAGTLGDIATAEGKQISAAVSLAVGNRVVAHATGGCRYCLPEGTEVRDQQPSTACAVLSPPASALSVVLLSAHSMGGGAEGDAAAAAAPAGLECDAAIAAARPHLERGRPRAASAAILATARGRLEGRMAAACVRLAATSSSSSAGSGEPPAKKQKTGPAPTKVRVRQIFLLHWRGSGAKPVDPIRRKPVERSLEDAEAQMLKLLDALVADNCGGFSAACKAASECQTALKGGDLIGDLGWLDRVVEPVKSQSPSGPVKSVVPAAVRRAAFELEVGELSDLVASERGVHLLLRTA